MSACSNLLPMKVPKNLFYRFVALSNTNTCRGYKNTICLPKSEFPHRVNANKRVERDRFVENKAKFEELYDWQAAKNNKGERFVLHDGPPYANGEVHIGHAVNKILKDITLRNKMLNGAQVHFVPGWDCHGLPIELKVVKETDVSSSRLSPIKVRKKAYDFAQQAKENQLMAFKRWGLLSDWKNSYATFHPDYIITQLNLFYSLYEKGLIYQDYKPVFWSPSNQTSLAEAELEYNAEHKSMSVYVKLPIVKCPNIIKSKLEPSAKLYAVIWTTTPWSLPANQAICYSASKSYSIIQCKTTQDFYISATETIPSMEQSLKREFTHIGTFEGTALCNVTYQHPVYREKELPFVSSHHVTMDKGTGLVHMAPNHGLEDYAAAKEHKIAISTCLVDEKGCYSPEAGEALVGKDVFGTGSETVLDLIKENVICLEEYIHSYPYDWRSNKPVIIRSSHQWFIDVEAIKEQAKLGLTKVEIIPESLKIAFQNQLEKSPQWCISRQRTWGVPIPVFYEGEKKTPITNWLIIDHICKLIKTKSIDCWWKLSDDELLPLELRQKCNMSNAKYEKGTDIFDIWFDSGISWSHVLPEPRISQLCLEGVDQIRGWFHSSLLTSIALRGEPPYRKLFLHGFTTDANGFKMSKSKGNVISPSDITDGVQKKKLPALGVDVLRWWVACHACQHENIAMKNNVFEECTQNVAKIRNVLKFLLGSLHQFNYSKDSIHQSQMKPLDQYMLHLLNIFSVKVSKLYDEMQYKNVGKEILNFVANEVSAFYCHLIKDRLYCEGEESVMRRSCQTVLFLTLDVLVRNLAPIVPHLAEEVYLYHPQNETAEVGVFRRNWESVSTMFADVSFPESILWANQVRSLILKSTTKTTNMEGIISCNGSVFHHLQTIAECSLCELFQVSKVSLIENLPEDLPQTAVVLHGNIDSSLAGENSASYTVILLPSTMEVCPRCRRCASKDASTLCSRCKELIQVKDLS